MRAGEKEGAPACGGGRQRGVTCLVVKTSHILTPPPGCSRHAVHKGGSIGCRVSGSGGL